MTRPKIDFPALKERVSLLDVANILGLQLKKDGAGLRCACPVHGDDTRSLVITPAEGFYCWGNKKGGDQIQLYAHAKGITNYEAAEALLRELGETPAQRATSPVKAEPEGRADLAEMLGISPAALQAMGATEGERLVIPLRKEDGTQIGTLGIATRADQVPLLAFVFDEKATVEAKPQPDELRKLFRVV